jgi:predicted nucleotidyltransferase
MDEKHFLELKSKLKKFFPREKIVFGGSAILGEESEFSDVDIYIICDNLIKFHRLIKDKERLREIKNGLPCKDNKDHVCNLHIMPKIFLDLGFYRVEGFYLEGDIKKKFFKKGDDDLIKLNSLKLCLKHLILHKLYEDKIKRSEKHFHNLQKNFYFLTDYKQDDLDQMETMLEVRAKKTRTFILFDWLFYLTRFRKILPFFLEDIVIGCLFNLKRYINTSSQSYADDFWREFSKLEKKTERTDDPQKMFEKIDRYIFLIFVI